jgi:hypothetical protein
MSQTGGEVWVVVKQGSLRARQLPSMLGFMSTLTVNLPDPLAERLAREAQERKVTPDAIVRQALEQALPREEEAADSSVFDRLQKLIVNDPASPTDLATNPAHLEGLGVARSA